MKNNEHRINLMRKDANEAIMQLQAGKDAKSVAAEIYVRALPQKEVALGNVMAERMEQAVCRFESLKESAFAQPDGWVEAQLDALCEDKTEAQRCETLLCVLAAVNGVQDAQMMTFDQASASAEKEAQLRQAVCDAFEGETLSANHAQALSEAEPEQSVEGLENVNAHDRRLVLSMLAYVQDESVQPEVAAAAVCHAEAVQDVLAKYGQEEAPKWLHILAQVAVMAALIGLYILVESVLLPAVLASGTIALEQSIMHMVRIGVIVGYARYGGKKVDELVDYLWNACRSRKKKSESAQVTLDETLSECCTEQMQEQQSVVCE